METIVLSVNPGEAAEAFAARLHAFQLARLLDRTLPPAAAKVVMPAGYTRHADQPWLMDELITLHTDAWVLRLKPLVIEEDGAPLKSLFFLRHVGPASVFNPMMTWNQFVHWVRREASAYQGSRTMFAGHLGLQPHEVDRLLDSPETLDIDDALSLWRRCSAWATQQALRDESGFVCAGFSGGSWYRGVALPKTRQIFIYAVAPTTFVPPQREEEGVRRLVNMEARMVDAGLQLDDSWRAFEVVDSINGMVRTHERADGVWKLGSMQEIDRAPQSLCTAILLAGDFGTPFPKFP